jgi:uncharacterized protein
MIRTLTELLSGYASAPAAALGAGLLCLAVTSCSCGGSDVKLQPAAPPGSVQLNVAGRTVTAELAVTHEQRRVGLMNRTRLDPDAGMLFIFPKQELQSFWMRDTIIPLDVVFLDEQGRVVNVAHGEPLVDTTQLPSTGPARSVLELNAGWCEVHGLGPGDRIEIPPEILALGRP